MSLFACTPSPLYHFFSLILGTPYPDDVIFEWSLSVSALTGKRVNNKKSDVKDYCLLSGHAYSFDDFTVLNYEPYNFMRLIKESLLITKDKQWLNKWVKSWVKIRTLLIPLMLFCYTLDDRQLSDIYFLEKNWSCRKYLNIANTACFQGTGGWFWSIRSFQVVIWSRLCQMLCKISTIQRKTIFNERILSSIL